MSRRDSDIDTVMTAPGASSLYKGPTSPKDDTFDPQALHARGDSHSNLIRGTSVRSKAPSQQTDNNRLTYIDEDFNYYANHPNRPQDDHADASLIRNAAKIDGYDNQKGVHLNKNFQDLEYADPYDPTRANQPPQKTTALSKFLGSGKYPLEQRIEDKKRGIGRQKYPFVVWALTATMIGVFIYELIVNNREQGSPVSMKPVVNYMLGPSSSALIFVGARFPPCMKLVEEIPPTFLMGCMNNTANPPTEICPISELCGFGGISADEDPNQWFRFITAIFLHAGFIHILLNMIAQLTLSAQIEREMGSGGFFIMYFAAGIFGNVLGGNFALVGIPSVGASGAIFGTVAVTWIDLLAHWKYKYRPIRQLVFMTIEMAIGVAIGFIPYVDNFAHLGGFLMGLLVGTIFYPVISTSKRHKTVMWAFRIAAIPLVIVLFVILIRNFYTSNPYAACSGCRYLSCIPTSANNHCQGTGLLNSTTTS